MRLSRSKSAEVGCAFVFALAALALSAPDFVARASSSAPVGHYLTVPCATAEVQTTPVLFWPFESYVPVPSKPETDGLSRNRDECVKYGCIDIGG